MLCLLPAVPAVSFCLSFCLPRCCWRPQFLCSLPHIQCLFHSENGLQPGYVASIIQTGRSMRGADMDYVSRLLQRQGASACYGNMGTRHFSRSAIEMQER